MQCYIRQLGYIWLVLLSVHFVQIYAQDCENSDAAPVSLALREAILKNLLQQPSIQISLENIDIQKGIAQSSAAPFDPVLNSEGRSTFSKDLVNIGQNLLPVDYSSVNSASNLNPSLIEQDIGCGAFHTHLKAHETVGHLDITKQTREGTRFLFSVDVDKINNPLNCPHKLNTSRVTIEVDQPLLRGRQYSLERMNELANRQLVNAVRFDTLQSISEQVLNTTFVYWDVVAARKNLQAQIESEKRLEVLVENIKYLIEHQQLAGSDILQPLAQLSSQVVARFAAEQAYYDTLQDLKFVMGEWDENAPCEDRRFEALEDFPLTEIIYPEDLAHIFCQLFPQVYRQRFDILASATREGVFTLLLQGAKNFNLPRLDVVGRMSWLDGKSGQHAETVFSSTDMKHPQKDITVGIVFSTPFYHDEAKGLIRQRQAQWAQTIANTRLLKQQTLNEISKALKNHVSLQDEVKKAQEAVDEYYRLLHNETKKLIAGYSTVFILLSFESYLINAIVQLISLQNLAAKNIARLRFLTGTLLRYAPLEDCRSFVVEDATQLPFKVKSPSADCMR